LSGTQISSKGLDARRRRLLFRAWHRGIREMDLLLGQFADAHIRTFTDGDIDLFEQLLEVPDQQLYAWLRGAEEVPSGYDTPLYRRIRDFHHTAKPE
jgi:antitoxin CptB